MRDAGNSRRFPACSIDSGPNIRRQTREAWPPRSRSSIFTNAFAFVRAPLVDCNIEGASAHPSPEARRVLNAAAEAPRACLASIAAGETRLQIESQPAILSFPRKRESRISAKPRRIHAFAGVARPSEVGNNFSASTIKFGVGYKKSQSTRLTACSRDILGRRALARAVGRSAPRPHRSRRMAPPLPHGSLT